MTSVLGDEDVVLRARAIEALEELGDQRAVPALIPLLGDGKTRTGRRTIRVRAAQTLATLGERGLVDAFRKALNGSPDALKVAAAPHRSAVAEALVTALEDSGRTTLVRAAQALAFLGAIEALPALRTKARRFGTRSEVVDACRQAIEELEARASLPRPAQAGPEESDPDTLPRPASDPRPEADTLPRVSEEDDEGAS